MSARYWKVTNVAGRACHGGTYQYDLPAWNGTSWTPGAWTQRVDDAVACERGWHLCLDGHLVGWLGARIWQVEVHPAAVTTVLDDKCVTTGPIRLIAGTPWDDTTARLFAVQCAARGVHLMTDERSINALDVAFRFALGDASTHELSAAWDAAWAAALAAASAEAWDAARDAARAAVGDAVEAARAAAWAAAWAAARAAGGAEALDAQTADLLEWLEAGT